MSRVAALSLALAALIGVWWLGRGAVEAPGPIPSKALQAESGRARQAAELVGPEGEASAEQPATPMPTGRPVEAAFAPPSEREQVKTPDKPVLLFEHADHDTDFPGRRWFLKAGFHTAPADFEGDEASAVRVPEGLRLVLYEAGDHSGARVVLGPGQHNLSPYGFNDRASSARVLREHEPLLDEVPLGPEDGIVLYDRRPSDGEPGLTWRLRPKEGQASTFITSRSGVFDPAAASAVWIPAGLELTLFVEPDGRGLAMVLGPGFHELSTVGFDDLTHSLRIRRVE